MVFLLKRWQTGEKMRLGQKFGGFSALSGVCLLLVACNTTPAMHVPTVNPPSAKPVDLPKVEQASFALKRVISSIKRGTRIANLPAGGVQGAGGTYCNFRYGEDAGLEWVSGRKLLGDWQNEYGEIFFDNLTNAGFNVAGDRNRVFGDSDAVVASDFWVGARITSIRGNFCNAHHWWDGRPLNKSSGELYMAVEWTIYSGLYEREIHQVETEGYYKLYQPKRRGFGITMGHAFANAVDHLATDEGFIKIATRRFDLNRGLGLRSHSKSIEIPSRRLYKGSLKSKIDRILSAVVTIKLTGAHGSGFAIAENGLIMTNQHVVAGAKNVKVVLSNGLEVEGKVLRTDARRDVALVKIPVRVPTALPLRTELPSVLEKVYALGSPYAAALKNSVTAGIVNAIRPRYLKGLPTIQADVPISGGNSGGPLVDARGNVVGISTAATIHQRVQNLNWFVPIGSGLKSLKIVKAVK
jgi:serine protease Do